MTTPPDWVTIKIFLATLDLGSITRAADRCGIATSAAAKRVQMLEADCGVALPERGARGVKLTPAGEIFAKHSQGLIDLAGRLTSDLKALSLGGLGTVRLHGFRLELPSPFPHRTTEPSFCAPGQDVHFRSGKADAGGRFANSKSAVKRTACD